MSQKKKKKQTKGWLPGDDAELDIEVFFGFVADDAVFDEAKGLYTVERDGLVCGQLGDCDFVRCEGHDAERYDLFVRDETVVEWRRRFERLLK